MQFGRISKERACPACHSAEVYRLKREGLTLRAVCLILNMRPHWCSNCDTFFLAPGRSKTVRTEEKHSLAGREPVSPGQPPVSSHPH